MSLTPSQAMPLNTTDMRNNSAIIGPAGTPKSHTLMAILMCHCYMGNRCLIVGPTNQVVEGLVANFQSTSGLNGPTIMRVYGAHYRQTGMINYDMCAHTLAGSMDHPGPPRTLCVRPHLSSRLLIWLLTPKRCLATSIPSLVTRQVAAQLSKALQWRLWVNTCPLSVIIINCLLTANGVGRL